MLADLYQAGTRGDCLGPNCSRWACNRPAQRMYLGWMWEGGVWALRGRQGLLQFSRQEVQEERDMTVGDE